MSTERLTKRSLYDAAVYTEVMERIGRLEPTSTPEWGDMNVSQMLAHCNEGLIVMNGTKELKSPFYLKLLRPIIRNAVVSDKAYKRSTATAPQYIKTDEHNLDFESEKQKLFDSVTYFTEMDKTKATNLKHPFFGKMTLEEKGWGMYKHMDYHLKQFGV